VAVSPLTRMDATYALQLRRGPGTASTCSTRHPPHLKLDSCDAKPETDFKSTYEGMTWWMTPSCPDLNGIVYRGVHDLC